MSGKRGKGHGVEVLRFLILYVEDGREQRRKIKRGSTAIAAMGNKKKPRKFVSGPGACVVNEEPTYLRRVAARVEEIWKLEA